MKFKQYAKCTRWSMICINHRDPAMPVLRDYRMADGTRKTEVDPDYERRYREHMMATASYPNWRDDPTYEMKGRRR